MSVRQGCGGLVPENMELGYNEVPVGEMVTIVDQPWLAGWHDNRLYLEAHQPLQDDIRDWPWFLPCMLDNGNIRRAHF